MKWKNDPDYVPSVFVYSKKSASSSDESVSRCKRLMQRCEHQYSASLQTRKSTTQTTTTPFATVTDNLPEEERDEENNDPQLQGATMDREVEEERYRRNDPQGATAAETDEQSEGSLCTEINNTDQPSITCSNCESNFKLLQTMKETILSQQDLIQNLSSFVLQMSINKFRPFHHKRCSFLHCRLI